MYLINTTLKTKIFLFNQKFKKWFYNIYNIRPNKLQQLTIKTIKSW
jgi:hypothetical protein